MSQSSDIKMLIVEDNALIAADLGFYLESEGFYISAIAHSASQAYDALMNREINFAMLDIHLGPGPSGLDIANVIHSKYHFPYIFLTSFDDDATITEAQKHAPYGYLVKPIQERTVLSTIKLAKANFERTNASKSQIEKAAIPAFDVLSKQEKTIANELIIGKSYKQISSSLFISINTVKFHAKNIYLKLQIEGRAELASLIH